MTRLRLTLSFACSLAAAPVSSQESMPKIGSMVEKLDFLDIRYLRRSLADFPKASGFVVFAVTNDCPIVLRYLPRLRALERKFRNRGIQFLALDVGTTDDIREMATTAVVHDIPFPFVKDLDAKAATALGVERTATAVVLTKDRRLHYRGRVDQCYRFGGTSPKAGRADLELAIEDLLADRKAAVAETSVEGCVITKRRKPVDRSLTFCRDIAPIVQRHCTECHRDGGEAPFALASYEDVSNNASMIAEVVRLRRMPPWYGSERFGDFANHRGLSADEIRTIEGWVNGGRKRGDPKDLPEPRTFRKSEWRIQKPDLVLRLPVKIRIPAEGYVPYKYFVFPYRFKEDTWIEQIEIRPENRRILHHANVARVKGLGYEQGGFITGYVPGGDPMVLDPGTALLIPAGHAIAIQCHYVTTGKREVDRIRLGIRFPRKIVRRRLRHLEIAHHRFEIPPHAPHHTVSRRRRLRFDAEGLGMVPHMHLRGKAMTFIAEHPDDPDENETLLLVPNYNFDWQQSYRWAPGKKIFPKGTRIRVEAHYDNSRFNPFNPDAERKVPFGLRTVDEMMYGFFFYLKRDEDLNLRIDPEKGTVLATNGRK